MYPFMKRRSQAFVSKHAAEPFKGSAEFLKDTAEILKHLAELLRI